MMARLEELERLNGLRESGVLTWEEYLVEKAKLLDDKAVSSGSGWRLPQGLAEWQLSRWSKLTTATIAIPIGILAVHFWRTALPSTSSAAREQTVATATAVDDPWTISSTTDPMTDQTIQTASASFPAQASSIEMQISCSSTGVIRHQATSFDLSGDAVAMTSEFNGDHWITPFAVRRDRLPPEVMRNVDPRFSNQVYVQTDQPTFGMTGFRRPNLWSADRLTFEFHLDGTDQTVIVDQRAPSLAGVLAPCIESERNRPADGTGQADRPSAAS